VAEPSNAVVLGLKRPGRGTRVRATGSSNRRRRAFGYALLAPMLLMLLGFIYVPLVDAVRTSLTDASLAAPGSHFVGLRQYRDLIESSRFWHIFYQTVVYTALSVAGSLVLGVLAAVWLRSASRFTPFVRAIMLVPWIAPPLVTAFVWAYLYRDTGPLGQLAYSLGLTGQEPVDFLGDRSGVAGLAVAFGAVVQVGIWAGFPFVFLFALAALTAIPEEVYEAARLDGAGSFALLRWITLPLIAPVIETTALLLTIIRFGGADLPFLLTGGGPGDSTSVFGVLIYNTAFGSLDSSKAAALGVMVFVLTLPLSVTYVRRSLRQMRP
jgi:multiple sugar transport system permease protein